MQKSIHCVSFLFFFLTGALALEPGQGQLNNNDLRLVFNRHSTADSSSVQIDKGTKKGLNN